MKKKIVLALTLLGLLFSGQIFTKQVQAASYGRSSKYTISKKYRGTWTTNDKKSLYSKIVIGVHTISFTRKSKMGATGTWTLYKQQKNWTKNKNVSYLSNAANAASKYKWVKAKNIDGGMEVNFSWSYNYESISSGIFKRSGNKLKFENIVHNTTFKKK